ncbi:hypothetical protein [Sphingopyxis sp. PET50]|uniref:hypothetical protein n=1 Tax=Sphingopyxis sp. PET50 TaxID=2976533 RepID=UPI0021AF3F55|nr:hypothetical protein [Sphingopyxis sp. PET50]
MFRTPGAGLGNLLFPILRAVIGQQERGGTFVYPTFAQFKWGPLLRGERDKRFYTDVARARRGGEWGDWLRSRLQGPSVGEDEERAATLTDGVIRYSGLRDYFHDLAGHQPLVRQWYAANMRTGPAGEDYDIAVHIRLGDFVADPGQTGDVNTRTSFDWYRGAIEAGAKQLGLASPRLLIFTDGSFDEVREGLGAADLRFDESGQAAAAMARMARARLIVTSRSTFSMWGAFLGDAPAIWDGNFDYREFFPHRAGLDISL